MRALRLSSAFLFTSSEGQEAKKGGCSLFGAKSRPLRTGSGRSRYSHRMPSTGRQATHGSVALLAASVVVSGLIDAADPKPRGLPSRSPDLPSGAALLVLVTTRSRAGTTRSRAGYRREDPGPRAEPQHPRTQASTPYASAAKADPSSIVSTSSRFPSRRVVAGPRTVVDIGTPSTFIASLMAPSGVSPRPPRASSERTRRCICAASFSSPFWAQRTMPTKSSGATLARPHIDPSPPARTEGRIRSSNPARTEKSGLPGLTSRSTFTVWEYSVTVSFSPTTLGHSPATRATREGERSTPVSIGRL